MKYQVVIPTEVLDAIDIQIEYLNEQGATAKVLDAWLAELSVLIDSLYQMPRKYPVAEVVSAMKGYEVRRMNYGEHAVFYRIDEEEKLVELLAFRHGRQRPWLEQD